MHYYRGAHVRIRPLNHLGPDAATSNQQAFVHELLKGASDRRPAPALTAAYAARR